MNNYLQLNGCLGTIPGYYGDFSIENKLEIKVAYTEANKMYNESTFRTPQMDQHCNHSL